MDKRKFKRLAKKSLKIEPSLIEITDDKEFMERVLKKSEEMQEETLRKAEKEKMTREQKLKKKWIEQAKEEARQNLSGEGLEKCFAALEAWGRNTML